MFVSMRLSGCWSPPCWSHARAYSLSLSHSCVTLSLCLLIRSLRSPHCLLHRIPPHASTASTSQWCSSVSFSSASLGLLCASGMITLTRAARPHTQNHFTSTLSLSFLLSRSLALLLYTSQLTHNPLHLHLRLRHLTPALPRRHCQDARAHLTTHAFTTLLRCP